MFTSVQSTYNIQKHTIHLMSDVPFYAEISRHVAKMPTDQIPTMAVAYDPRTEDLCMGYNPKFCEKLTDWQVRNVLIHEFLHLIFGHLSARRKTPPKLWNVATDCAINSLIIDDAQKFKSGYANVDRNRPLPPGCLIPGEWPTMPDGRELNEEEKKGATLGHILSKLPPMKSSEFYYFKILEEAEKMGKGAETGEGGEGFDFDSFDDHGFWDSVPDDKKDLVESKIKDMLGKAVKNADTSDGWGNISAELRDDIRRSVTRIVDWKAVLRQFTGSLIRGKKRTSIKRINRRFPYIHAGQTKGYTARLLVCIDQSGSVDDGMLQMFFSELRSLNKNVEIDYLPFDCEAYDKDIVTWNRGRCPDAKRTRAGGTDFSAPTRVANDPKNRGRWDGVLIFTDGECSQPIPSRLKRGWIIGQGQKLLFNTTETVISLNDGKINTGAWR